jgi:hypothetical protein
VSSLVAGYLVTSLVSILLLLAAWRRPRVGRLLFALLFLSAGVFNAVTALRTPQVYVEGFAPLAIGPFRELIERVVALAPDAFVLAIALGQFLVAAGLAFGRGWPVRAGAIGATVFLLAISWLGVGAAFPTNLVLAAGAALLLRAAPAASSADAGRTAPHPSGDAHTRALAVSSQGGEPMEQRDER